MNTSTARFSTKGCLLSNITRLEAFVGLLVVLMPFTLHSQDGPPSTLRSNPSVDLKGEIRFSDRDGDLSDAEVYLDMGLRSQLRAVTDGAGRFEFRGVSVGTHTLTAYKRSGPDAIGPPTYQTITVDQTTPLLRVVLNRYARLSGIITDENGVGVSGVGVYLVSREYFVDTIHYMFAAMTRTNKDGRYSMANVSPGRPYLVLARNHFDLDRKNHTSTSQLSSRTVHLPTYYPRSSWAEGAEPLVLSSGEHRDTVNIRMRSGKSLCINGKVRHPSGNGAVRYGIADETVVNGSHSGGETYIAPRAGVTALDGTFSVCGLYPGTYLFTSAPLFGNDASDGLYHGSSRITLYDEDLRELIVDTKPARTLIGAVTYDTSRETKPESLKVSIALVPKPSATLTGSTPSVMANVNDKFAISGVLDYDYAVRLDRLPKGTYVKSITYDGHRLRYGYLPLSTGSHNGRLDITLAASTATVKIRVVDRDNRPVPGNTILFFPKDVASSSELAAALLSGLTDQHGYLTLPPYPPGPILLLAVDKPIDRSVQSIQNLWGRRLFAKELVIPQSGSLNISVPPSQ